MATVVDDKIKTLRGIQGEMEELFQTKQASLSQFNENTLVKSVPPPLFRHSRVRPRPTSHSPTLPLMGSKGAARCNLVTTRTTHTITPL